MRAALFVLTLCTMAASGQTPSYSPHDCAFSAAGVATASLPCTAEYTDTAMPIPTLRYGYAGTAVEFTVPAVDGLNYVTLYFVEPNKTAAGQRVFTVRVNDGLPFEVDVFKATRAMRSLLAITLPPSVVTGGKVRVLLRSVVGNAMLSNIRVDAVGVNGVKVTQWLKCEGATGPTSNCTGLNFVELRAPNGSLTQLIATTIPDGFAPGPQWTPAP